MGGVDFDGHGNDAPPHSAECKRDGRRVVEIGVAGRSDLFIEKEQHECQMRRVNSETKFNNGGAENEPSFIAIRTIKKLQQEGIRCCIQNSIVSGIKS